MLSIAILVLREVLEASLIISVVYAATRGIPGRGRWVGLGIAAGVVGALLVAAFAGAIASAVSGIGQEVFNAGVLLAAVIMIGWHAIWMSSHGKALVTKLKSVGTEVSVGHRPLAALLVVVGIAVLREGSEAVLFVYAQAANGSDWIDLVAGVGAGILGGAAIGLALYLGLLRIPMRYFFTATNWLLLLVAAGMAAQAANFLVQADILPALGSRLWDTSALLSDRSLFGQTLHALIGYDARPAGIQLAFYFFTVAIIVLGMKLCGKPKSPVSGAP
ncbi:MAG TPA: FTR1 family protein [Casimicrobiaceae bacterium]|nr:FTR1 family protein [Casimicrobiaceae bacterium]